MSFRRLFVSTFPLTLFILLFGLSAFLGMQVTYDPMLLGDVPLAILISVGLYLGAVYLIRTTAVTHYLTLFLIAVCAVFALLFIGQFRYQDYSEIPEIAQRLGGVTTFLPDLAMRYLHPNAVASVLEVVLPVAVAFVLSRSGALIRVFAGFTALVFIYALFLSASRGAFAGLIAAVLVLCIVVVSKRLPRLVIWAGVLAAAVAVIVGVIALYHLDPAQPLPILNRPVDPRLALYHNSLYLGLDYLFTGIGLGDTFGDVYSRYSLLIQPLFVSYASNLLLSVWLNQGLLGLVAFLGIIAMYYRFVRLVLQRTQTSMLFHGLWSGVTAALVHGLFDARHYTDSVWVMSIFFVAIGLTVAHGQSLLRQDATELSTGHGIQHRLRYGLVAFVLIAVLLVIFRAHILAAWYTNLGALDETRADFAHNLTSSERQLLADSAVQYYNQALDVFPAYAPASRRLGNLYVARDAFTEAIPLLERAYAGEPTNPAAIKGLGLAYTWTGRTQDAAQLFWQLPNVKDVANELYTWGYYWSSEEQGQPLLAAYAWETAEFMGDGTNIDVWMQMADFYIQADAMDRAYLAYQHVLELDPTHSAARDAMEHLESASDG